MHDCIAERGRTAGARMLNEDAKMNCFMAAITQHLGIWLVEDGAQLRGKCQEIKSFEGEVGKRSAY